MRGATPTIAKSRTSSTRGDLARSGPAAHASAAIEPPTARATSAALSEKVSKPAACASLKPLSSSPTAVFSQLAIDGAHGHALGAESRAERLARGAASAAEQSRIRRWATWLERLGDGELGGAQDEVGHADLSEWFDDICHRVDDVAGVQAMLRSVYDCRDEDLASQPTEFWSNRAIVTPRHVSVDYLNDLMLQRVPGDEITLNSADVVDLDDRGLVEVTSDFLNAQNPPGMPPHVLKLKLNAVVILLRNLDRKRGLVNGTRLQVREVVGNRLLRCDILSGECRGRTCVIPRIKLKPPKSRLHVSWYRVQFPVKLAYAMSKLRRSRRPPASALPPTRCSFAHSATPAP